MNSTMQPITTPATTAHDAESTRALVKPLVVCCQMAQYFLEHPQCTRDDLVAAGFSDAEINAHAAAARELAARRWHGRD